MDAELKLLEWRDAELERRAVVREEEDRRKPTAKKSSVEEWNGLERGVEVDAR